MACSQDRMQVSLGRAQQAVNSALQSLDYRQLVKRLAEHDPYLWTSDPSGVEAIRKRLGWMGSIDAFLGKVKELSTFAAQVKEQGFEQVVLLGMGGSSLCPEVCSKTFGSAKGWPALSVLDNTDPQAVREVESKAAGQKTLFVVASKSGTTTETDCFYRTFYERLKSQTGGNPGGHFVAITDPETSLCREAEKKKFLACFENPTDIGGRYSALSYFGLVPMALMGMDISQFLTRAQNMQDKCGVDMPLESNPGVHLGALLGFLHKAGHDKLTLVVTRPMDSFGDWAEQLIAESTGKMGTGIIPVVGETLGSAEMYGQDRVFVCLMLPGKEATQLEEKIMTFEQAGHPVIRILIKDKMDLGREFIHWELATATASTILKINPFDEPNVKESKENTKALLTQWQQHGKWPEEKPLLQENSVSIFFDPMQEWAQKLPAQSLSAFAKAYVDLARKNDYLALLPYFVSSPKRQELLQNIRMRIRDQKKIATTLCPGPRYLHSTGQLHKGGPASGLYWIFTAETKEDHPIPGEKFSFGILQRAQALGDFLSLKAKNRRVIRVHFEAEIENGLEAVLGALG